MKINAKVKETVKSDPEWIGTFLLKDERCNSLQEALNWKDDLESQGFTLLEMRFIAFDKVLWFFKA